MKANNFGIKMLCHCSSTDVVCHINRVCHWLSTRVWRNLLFTTHSIVLFHLHHCPCLPWLQLPVDTIAFHPVLPFYLFFHILISSFPFSNLNKIKYIFFLLTIQWGRVVSTGLQAGDSKLTKSMLKDFQAGGRYLQTLAIKWEKKSAASDSCDSGDQGITEAVFNGSVTCDQWKKYLRPLKPSLFVTAVAKEFDLS